MLLPAASFLNQRVGFMPLQSKNDPAGKFHHANNRSAKPSIVIGTFNFHKLGNQSQLSLCSTQSHSRSLWRVKFAVNPRGFRTSRSRALNGPVCRTLIDMAAWRPGGR